MTAEERDQAQERLKLLNEKLAASERLGEGYGERVRAIKAEIQEVQAGIDVYEEENP